MIMAATALLKDKPDPTDKDIDDAMTNICQLRHYNRVRATHSSPRKRWRRQGGNKMHSKAELQTANRACGRSKA